MSEEDPLLQLEGVEAGYREEVPVLRGIDLEVARGEILGLVSLDAGGGKTTLLRVAAGLHTPWAGRVRFDGVDVYGMSFRADQSFRARCAVVLEGGALLVNQTVWDNVALPLRYHRGLRGRELTVQVKRLLDLTGFEEDAHLFPWQVSARGRKLAAFSRALSRDPSLVLVDRFFEGLEMPDWKRLFELVLELNHGQGTAWVLGSEVDPVVFQAAERVLVLDEGAVLACGARKQLYRDDRIREAFEEALQQEVRGARKTSRMDPGLVEPGSTSSDELLVISDSEEGLAGAAVEAAAEVGRTIDLDGVMPAPPARPSTSALDDPDRTVALDPEEVARGRVSLQAPSKTGPGGAGAKVSKFGKPPPEADATINLSGPARPAPPRPKPPPAPQPPPLPEPSGPPPGETSFAKTAAAFAVPDLDAAEDDLGEDAERTVTLSAPRAPERPRPLRPGIDTHVEPKPKPSAAKKRLDVETITIDGKLPEKAAPEPPEPEERP